MGDGVVLDEGVVGAFQVPHGLLRQSLRVDARAHACLPRGRGVVVGQRGLRVQRALVVLWLFLEDRGEKGLELGLLISRGLKGCFIIIVDTTRCVIDALGTVAVV